jgi:hypothetical protein
MSDLKNNYIRVLHIAGTGRNGSTLIERVLNEIPNFFAAGELADADLNKDQCCFCGKKFGECPVWGNIINDAAIRNMDKKILLAETGKKYRMYVNLIKRFFTFKKKMPDDVKQYSHDLQMLYSVIHQNRPNQIITDSSTSLLHGYCLSLIPAIDLYVVHLVRDPRGVAYSQSQPKLQSNSNLSQLQGVNPFILTGFTTWKVKPWRSAWGWIRKNFLVELLFKRRTGKYLRIHYEDFVENPTKVLKEIENMLDIERSEEHLNFIKGNRIKLGEHHLTWGNVSSFGKGEEEIVLKLDNRWKRNMKLINIILVTLITGPLLLKYFLIKDQYK